MSYEKIDTKYLSEKRKQTIEWNPENGSIKKTIFGADGKILKEEIKKISEK